MFYTVNIQLRDETDLTSLGVQIATAMSYSSMDSIFTQFEFICITNDVDLIGRGVIRYGTELIVSIYANDTQVSKFYYCVYNYKLIDQLTKHSTVGTLRIACVNSWYFKQQALTTYYTGTVGDVLFNLFTTEIVGDYVQFQINQHPRREKSIWYRCNMTASKFIKTILEPNFLIDESPAYIFANDLGQLFGISYFSLVNQISSIMVTDNELIAVTPNLGDKQYILKEINDYKIDMGDEYVWQGQAQRLDFLSKGGITISGGVEPMSYLSPGGVFPQKLVQMEYNYYLDPELASHVVMDDTGKALHLVRANFLNTYRKKAIESFKIYVSMENEFLLTVGSVLDLRLTSLPMGSPDELKQRITMEQLKYPYGIDSSLLSGTYFIKEMRRSFRQLPNGYFTSSMDTTIIKIQ